jgi:hypothetical protein
MKRIIICLTIVLVAVGYLLASPFVGLAHLRSAIDARNASALSERIDFQRLRNSLGQQIVSTYLKITGKSAQLGQLGTSIATSVGASMAEPLLADLVNPEMMLDLLSGSGVSTASLQIPAGLGPFSKDAVGSAWQIFINTEYGIGNFYIRLPTSTAATEQFRLRFQVLQWNWKITAIDLPERLRVELAKELQRRIG